MNFLIDTNILIWFLEGNDKLNKDFKKEIINSDNEIFISSVSLWEITIKYSLKKLELSSSLESLFDEIKLSFFKILSLKTDHLLFLDKLPYIHKDPFDRLIYAQAKSENYTFLYSNEIFNKYNEKLK